MATKDDQDTLRLLVQHVGRAFYDAKYVVVLDQLTRHPVIKEDELAGRIGMQAKELNKLTAVLSTDCLIKVHRQNELKEGAQRAIGKQYYYIDYRHFCNVVKWRMAQMRSTIDSSLRNELDNKGYVCPQCTKSFTTLDADRLIDPMRGEFICDDCGGILIDNENAENVLGSQDKMQRFNRQTKFVREGLRKTESMVLPAFDVAMYVRAKMVSTDTPAAAAQDGLKIAGQDGTGVKDEGIGVLMTVDKDEATRARERAEEAEAKRQQNVMPEWHLKSTISGDLTALGHAAHAAQSSSHTVDGLPNGSASSNLGILQGLGSSRPTLGYVGGPQMFMEEEEGKATVRPTHESVLYDQYYATLQSQQQAAASSAVNSPGEDSWGSDDDEEDKKPDINFLNSLQHKRSRSGDASDGGRDSKVARLGEEAAEEPVPALDDADKPPDDDPIVQVNGESMRFSEVTEEHQETMTTEEYEAYFQVMQNRV